MIDCDLCKVCKFAPDFGATMNFGTVFISLIGLTITVLLVPQFFEAAFQKNTRLLGKNLAERGFDPALFADAGQDVRERAKVLWAELSQPMDDLDIRRIKRQKYIPFVTVLVFIEVCILSVTTYAIARGRDIPGFVEDMAVAMSILLAVATIWAAYRIMRDNRAFNRYFSNYREFRDLLSSGER